MPITEKFGASIVLGCTQHGVLEREEQLTAKLFGRCVGRQAKEQRKRMVGWSKVGFAPIGKLRNDSIRIRRDAKENATLLQSLTHHAEHAGDGLLAVECILHGKLACDRIRSFMCEQRSQDSVQVRLCHACMDPRDIGPVARGVLALTPSGLLKLCR